MSFIQNYLGTKTIDETLDYPAALPCIIHLSQEGADIEEMILRARSTRVSRSPALASVTETLTGFLEPRRFDKQDEQKGLTSVAHTVRDFGTHEMHYFAFSLRLDRRETTNHTLKGAGTVVNANRCAIRFRLNKVI